MKALEYIFPYFFKKKKKDEADLIIVKNSDKGNGKTDLLNRNEKLLEDFYNSDMPKSFEKINENNKKRRK